VACQSTPSDLLFECLLKGARVSDLDHTGLSLEGLDLLELWGYVQKLWQIILDAIRSSDRAKLHQVYNPSGGLFRTYIDIRQVILRKRRKQVWDDPNDAFSPFTLALLSNTLSTPALGIHGL
jgi:hypothetical protein